MTTKILPQEEVWKPIPGYEKFFAVSTHGRVKSLERKIKSRNLYGSYVSTKKEKLLTAKLDRYGYPHLGLRANTKRTWFTVHRLVAMTFLPNPKNHPQINHKNSDKTDNRLENIEWCSASHNQKHAYQNGHHALCLHRDPVTGRMKGVE